MKRKTKLTAWLVTGIILFFGPLWGWFGTVIGMVMAFVHFDEAELQVEALTHDMNMALYTTAVGLIVVPLAS
jgi:biopolymer transport protein ExbB/TolQ